MQYSDLPSVWIQELLMRMTDISKDMLDKISAESSDNVMKLLEFICQVEGSDPLPAQCLHKVVCGEVFLQRAKQVGDPWRRFKDDSVDISGAVDFQSCIWEFEVHLRRVISITHRPSRIRTLLDMCRVTTEWHLVDPVYETRTAFVKGSARVVLADLYAAGEGPHQWAITKKQNSLNALAKAMATKMQLATRTVACLGQWPTSSEACASASSSAAL